MRDLTLAYHGPRCGITTKQIQTLDKLIRLLAPLSIQLIYTADYRNGNLSATAIAARCGMAVQMVRDIRIADALIACSGDGLETGSVACYKICSEMRSLHRPVYLIHSDGKIEING